MDRNTTIAFILIGAILVFWLFLNSPEPPTNPKEGKTDSTIVVDKEEFPADIQKDVSETDQIENIKDSINFGQTFINPDLPERTIVIENDVARIELSTHGGNIKKYFLKKYNNWYSAKKNGDSLNYQSYVQLINYTQGNAYDIYFVSTEGKTINTGGLEFSVNTDAPTLNLSGKDSLTLEFTFNVNENSSIKKLYTIYGSGYSIRSSLILHGMNNIISNSTYDLLWGTGIRFVEKNSVDEANYSNASIYYGDEQVIIDASDETEKKKEDFNGRVDWMAVRNKYFAAIIIPEDPSSVEGAYVEGERKVFGNSGIREIYSVGLIIPFKNTIEEKHSFIIYIGPVEYDQLKEYGRKLEAIVDFGSFFGLKFIVRPIAEYVLLPLFTFLHSIIPNYGFVIIVFSLIIKFVLYPLTKTSYKSMKKMQLLQPKIAELKEKLKDDPQKLNKETMKMYQTYGINPAGGCLPILLQMPIFVALWGLFQTAIELRQQPFALWINDLSQPDMIYDLGFKLPMLGIQHISGLALLMGITTFVQQKMSVKDPKQQGLVYIMPVMLTLLFMSFPSGLNLYYFMFNAFTIAQQYYINHQHSDIELVPVKNPKNKKGFMARLMESAEQKTKAQQKRKR